MAVRAWTGRQYRASVIRSHRATVEDALSSYDLSDDQRGILQRVSDRLGVRGQPILPDVVGMDDDARSLPEGPPPAIGDGKRFADVRRSGEFVQSQPWLVPSVELLIEWELRSLGRLAVQPMTEVAAGFELADLWKPLCAWAGPFRRDRQGSFRLARRAAEYLFGAYPWDEEWTEEGGELPREIREALEAKRAVILDYARVTRCGCGACQSRREEIAAAVARFDAKHPAALAGP